MNVLLIKNGVVENCISADSVARAKQFYPDHTCVERVGSEGPGYIYNGTTFAAPAPVVQPKQPITKLEFLRRFPTMKRIAIREASKTDAILGDAMALLDLAQDISVEDSDTVMLVGYCVQQGFLTQAEAGVILC
jgi:hypothetical protein